jgi:DNA-binding NarL/FixJ family response regulator
MRQATFVISSGRGGLHPADAAIAAEPDIQRLSIRQIDLLDDGTGIVLYTSRGDLERGKQLLDARDDIYSVDYVGETDGVTLVHFEPNDTVRELLAVGRSQVIALDLPIECLPDGGVRVTVIGNDAAISEAVDDMPESLALSLESMGAHDPDRSDPFASLTERQQEILLTALELGYFETPRETNQEAIAEELGVSTATVGEHLRRIQAELIPSVVPRALWEQGIPEFE